MRRLFFWIVLFFMLLPSAAMASTVSGVVQGEQESGPVPLAEVKLLNTSFTTFADDDGRYQFADVPAGRYTLSVSSEGYKTNKQQIDVPAEGELVVDVVLAFSAVFEEDELVITDRAPVDESTQTSAHHFTREEIADNAGAFEDITKAIQQLPGVVSNTDFTSDMYVRGSASWENLIVIDNQLLANPYHFGVGLSVINTDLVDNFTFYAAGFPAQYPFATGGVLDVTYRDGNRDHPDGQISVSMLSASALTTGPLGDKVTWVFSGRRSYYDYMLQLLNWTDVPIPVFSDVFGRLTFEPNSANRFVVFLMRSEDGARATLEENPSTVDEGDAFYNTLTQVYGIDHSFMPVNWFLLGTTFSYQILNFDGNVSSGTDQFFGHAQANGLYVNEDIQFDLGRNVFKLGGVYSHVSIDMRSAFPLQQFVRGARFANEQQSFNIAFNESDPMQLWGCYVQHEAEIIPDRLRSNIGSRFDYYMATRNGWAISPRASLATNLAPETIAKVAWGLYYIPPYNYFATDEEFGNPDLRSERQTHYVVGLEQGLGENMLLRVESFYKEFEDQTYMKLEGQTLDLTETFSLLLEDELPEMTWVNSGYGRAMGAEVFFQKKLSDWWDGWLAYSLTEVRYNDGMGMYGWYYPMYDQRHTLSLVANFRPMDDWVFSGTFRLASGRPYTPILDWKERYPGTLLRYWEPQMGQLNSARFPLYHKLDVRVERTWHPHQRLNLVGFFEIYNVYNARNVWGYWYEDEQGLDKPVRKTIYQIPFLPYMGIKAEFL